jgi:hypothetical protein
MTTIYRGYNVEKDASGKYAIYKDGNHIYTLPTTDSEEAALAWIDAEKRRQRDANEGKR